MSSRPHSPRSRSPDSRPSSRAFIRQCVFYEKYGGCKFGKDCFYAHNDEMTLGVRNAMQMAQQMGKGGIGGGVEIRFDERENEVKMVRVVETFPVGNERDREATDRNGFGRRPRFGGGRGRFMGRGRGNFRGVAIRGRGPLQRGGRYISPIRGSGNIFAESPDERDRRKRKEHKMDRRSRSTTPRRKHSRRSKSASSSSERKHKRKGRGGSRSSSSSESNSRSNSPSPTRKRSNSPKEMRRRRKRCSESPPDPSRMELRSLAKKMYDGAEKDEGEDKKQQRNNCSHYHDRIDEGKNGDKHNRRRRSSSKSSSDSSSKNGSSVDIKKGKEEERKGKNRWEEKEEAYDQQQDDHKGKYSPNAVYLIDDREGEEEELMFEMVGEEEGDEEEGKKGREEEEEECRQRKELLEGFGRKRKRQHDGDKKEGSIFVGFHQQKKNFLSIRPKYVVASSTFSNRSPNIRSPSPSRPSSSSGAFGYKH